MNEHFTSLHSVLSPSEVISVVCVLVSFAYIETSGLPRSLLCARYKHSLRLRAENSIIIEEILG